MRRCAALFLLAVFSAGLILVQSASSQSKAQEADSLHYLMIVTTQPWNALVTVDGSDAGRAPLRLILERGRSYQFEVSLPDYQPWKKTILNSHTDSLVIRVDLQATHGNLSIVSADSSYRILLADSAVGHAGSFSQHLPVGSYPIEVQDSAHERSIRRTVFLPPGTDLRVQARLGFHSHQTLLYSSLIPGWGQAYDRSYTEGAVYTLAFLTGAVLSLKYNGDYHDRIRDYDRVRLDYLAASNEADARARSEVMKKAYGKMDDAFKTRRTALFFTGAVYVLNLASAYFFHDQDDELLFIMEKSRSEYDPFTSAVNETYRLGLSVHF